MKKAVRMAVAAGMCAALALSAGCQKKTVADDEVQRYAWPLATASPEDTVTQIYAEKFAEEVEELSDGKMKIQVYPNGTIGGDRELLESCKDGDIPFVIQNTAPQVTFMPDLAVFDIPCRFSTIDEVREKVDDPEFYGLLEDVYENGGYKLLGYADQGFRVMSTNKMVESLADFKGQKIRTMENSYHMDFWKKLKASPTPMSFSEVYIGLQQGTIDAQENPYEVIVSNKLYEQQDYVVETNHLPHHADRRARARARVGRGRRRLHSGGRLLPRLPLPGALAGTAGLHGRARARDLHGHVLEIALARFADELPRAAHAPS